MNDTIIIFLIIWAVGYYFAFRWCKAEGKGFWESACISVASWGLLILYLIHYYHNKKD